MKKNLTTRDQRLRRDFNITEEEFNTAFTKQGKVCYACYQPPKTRSLHVDHDHTIAGWKVLSIKDGKVWRAWPEGHGPNDVNTGQKLRIIEEDRLKSVALRKVKRKLLRVSVRGILCWHCNASLKKIRDNKQTAANLSMYLWNYHNYVIGLTQERNGFK